MRRQSWSYPSRCELKFTLLLGGSRRVVTPSVFVLSMDTNGNNTICLQGASALMWHAVALFALTHFIRVRPRHEKGFRMIASACAGATYFRKATGQYLHIPNACSIYCLLAPIHRNISQAVPTFRHASCRAMERNISKKRANRHVTQRLALRRECCGAESRPDRGNAARKRESCE